MNPRIDEIQIEDFDLSLMEMRLTNDTRILQLERSMQVHGQLQPVVARVYEGGIQLIDGFKRLSAAETLMMDSLQCRLLDVDEQQAKILLLSYNRAIKSMEVLEEALVLRDLIESHDLDQRRLAKLTGHSPSWVSRRLSLISKLDEELFFDIRMGSLTVSHARSLIRLPRGNQLQVARTITSYRLSSRQANHLVDAFLEAKDTSRQCYILERPEVVLVNMSLPEEQAEEPLFDPRLCGYGNDLLRSISYIVKASQILLSRLRDYRQSDLEETERIIITPGLNAVAGYADKLSEAITYNLINQNSRQDEK